MGAEGNVAIYDLSSWSDEDKADLQFAFETSMISYPMAQRVTLFGKECLLLYYSCGHSSFDDYLVSFERDPEIIKTDMSKENYDRGIAFIKKLAAWFSCREKECPIPTYDIEVWT